MTAPARPVPNRFRVWLVRPDCAEAGPSDDGTPLAMAVEPAEPGTMSARQARAYVERFNRVAAHTPSRLRAVALPVVVRYEGEPRPGEAVPVAVVKASER